VIIGELFIWNIAGEVGYQKIQRENPRAANGTRRTFVAIKAAPIRPVIYLVHTFKLTVCENLRHG
jgi:hypothetical protein